MFDVCYSLVDTEVAEIAAAVARSHKIQQTGRRIPDGFPTVKVEVVRRPQPKSTREQQQQQGIHYYGHLKVICVIVFNTCSALHRTQSSLVVRKLHYK